MKKLFHVALALILGVSAAFAQEDLEKRVGGLQAQVDRALSKAGIHFGGEFRSQYLNSQLSGDALQADRKRSESAEFTSVDFDIVARPNTALNARAVFRLHQDWRNFFSDVQNPITTRWLSIDGAVGGGMLEYHVGDYRKKLSPLTLWNHEFEIFYEPEIFAADRRLALSEAFLGDSKRLMQGFDLSFKAELYPILKEIEVDAFGARLAARGTQESGVVPPGKPGGGGDYVAAEFDKYLLGANIGSQITEGAGFAVSNIYIYDYIASFDGDEDAAKARGPQSTNVTAGRLNFDTRTIMDADMLLAGINAEVAYSSDKQLVWGNGTQASYDDTTVTGMAVNAGLSLRLAFGEGDNVKLAADYVMNDKTFRNDAVQSPHFIQRQIMNSENGISGLGVMNPFDALYRTVFKYAPSQYFGGTEPYTKNAYNNAILTPSARADYVSNNDVKSPSIFQAAGNKATADRTGPMVKLDGAFLENALTVGARLTMFKAMEESEYEYYYDITNDDGEPDVYSGSLKFAPEFLTAGGGASIDVAKFVPALGQSLKIGGSFMMYNATTGKIVPVEGTSLAFSKQESESRLISAELTYNFAPRFSFLAGYQQLTTTVKTETNDQPAPDAEYTFDNLGVGFGYKVADGGDLTVKLTRLSGEGPVSGGTKSYRAIQPEVSLTVKF